MNNKPIDIIKKGVDEIINEDLLIKKLNSSKPLVIKAGFDPTAPDLHLGHTVVINKMRQLQDQLSLKAMEVFKGTMEPEDLKLAFDLNRGVYMTRSFRMFDDNNFVAKISDFEDSTYEQERERAVMYFARQDALNRAEGFAKEEGLSLAAAKIEIKDQVNAKDATHMSEGKRLLEEFIRGYHKGKRAGALGLSTDTAGANLTIPTELFQTEGLQKIVVEINEKGNIPEEIRDVLGEYKEDQGLSNISRSIAYTAEVVANQSFFNKFKKLNYGQNKRSSEHIGMFGDEPFDKQTHEKYLKHEKIENLTGLEMVVHFVVLQAIIESYRVGLLVWRNI